MSIVKYTEANKELSRIEYSTLLNEECINVFTPLVDGVVKELNQQLVDSCDLFDAIDKEVDTSLLVPFVAESIYSQQLKDLDLDPTQRKAAWKYRKLSIHDIQIETILYGSKKKLPNRLMNAFKALYEGFVRSSKGDQVALGAVLHPITKALAIKDIFKPSSCEEIELSDIDKQSIGFQFIVGLSEMGMINVFISDKTHMIKWTDNMLKEFSSTNFNKLVKLSKFLKAKTIFTDKVSITEDKMLSQSSWYYKTPALSEGLIEYLDTVQGIKYKFKEFTGDEFIQAYKNHCDIEELKGYDEVRINALWEQVEASRKTNGHYVKCMGDSVWRNYMMAEFGHFQTSHAFRDLVKVEGIDNPIKYDATNSVLQMYALGLKSGNLAQYVGLLETKTGDFRTIIANSMNDTFDTNVFTKDGIKPVFMIWAYNAGKDRILNGSPKVIVDPFDGTTTLDYTNRSQGLIDIAKGVKYGAEDTLYEAFIDILQNLVPEIFFLKAIFKKLVKGNAKELYTWTLPDGAIAQYANVTKKDQDKDTMEDIVEAIDKDGDRHIHTVYTKSLKVSTSLAGLLPRVIHSIDAYIQRQIVVRAHKLGIVVVPNHDSFMFDEQYKEVMFNLIKDIYAEVMETRVLANIVKELNISKVDLTIKAKGNVVTANDFIEASSFGELTREDVMKGAPVEEEEI